MPNDTKASTYDTLIDGLMDRFGQLSSIDICRNTEGIERVVDSMCKIAETVSAMKKDKALYGDEAE